MTVRVAVDFGTSSTCVAVAVDGREPQVVITDGQPLISSAVFAAADGTVFVGQEAERQAAIDPSRYEPHPKRRIDEGELLLGERILPVQQVIGAVLRRAVDEARRFAGNRVVDLLVLTHPAEWGPVRARTLHQAGAGLAQRVVLVPEPVGAAVFHAASHAMGEGQALAVLDLGGGTVDASVVRRAGDRSGVAGFDVLATRGDPNFGGADIDQALVQYLGSRIPAEHAEAWQTLVAGDELADRRRRRVLRADVRSAKETLSRHAYTDVPLPPPFTDAHVTRAELERLIEPQLRSEVELLAATIAQARVSPQQLAGVFLVGGSSRIPLVARLVQQRIGVLPSTLDQPETVVARGALRAVTVDPEHTSASSRPQQPVRQPAPPRPAPAYPVAPLTQVPPAAPQPQSRPKPRRRGWLLGGGAIVVLGALVGGYFLFRPDAQPDTRASHYDFTFEMPPGWKQTQDDAQKRQVTLGPISGDEAIVTQEFQLSDPVDDANKAKFADELRGKLDQAGGFSGFDAGAKFADRDVIYYRGSAKDGRQIVDWYVLAQGHVQVSVGCQYTKDARANIESPCQTVVRSLQIREPS